MLLRIIRDASNINKDIFCNLHKQSCEQHQQPINDPSLFCSPPTMKVLQQCPPLLPLRRDYASLENVEELMLVAYVKSVLRCVAELP
jgi:hypothetical protein